MLGIDAYWVTWFPGVLLACVGVLALVWKGIIAFNGMIEAGKSTAKIEAHVVQLGVKVDRMEHEFHPNSGTSLRDQVDAVRSEQTVVATKLIVTGQQMTDHIGDDAQAFGRQERWNGRVESQLDRIEDHVRGK